MPTVRVQPANIDLEVKDGESVAEAAWRQGYVWPTNCWGQLECMSCFARVVDGELAAEPAGELENDAKRLRMSQRLGNDPLIRLGCQLKCKSDGLVVDRPGFRMSEPEDNNMTEPISPGGV